MNPKKLEDEKYKHINLIRVSDNKWENNHFFIRKYSSPTNLHRHEYIQVNYIYEGSGKHFINNNSFAITKGDIFVIPPYIPHCIVFEPDTNLQIIEFEFEIEFINETFHKIEDFDSFFDFAYIEPFLVSESNIKPRLNLVGKEQSEVENLLIEALHEYNAKRPGYALISKSNLLKLLVIVGRLFSEKLKYSEESSIYARYKDMVFNAIEYIDTNYNMDLKLQKIAKMFYFSSSYFSFIFKAVTGKKYIEYINDLRLSKAMELLKTTNKKVLDISIETGFNNVTHFNRAFKKKTGISPVAYRNTR